MSAIHPEQLKANEAWANLNVNYQHARDECVQYVNPNGKNVTTIFLTAGGLSELRQMTCHQRAFFAFGSLQGMEKVVNALKDNLAAQIQDYASKNLYCKEDVSCRISLKNFLRDSDLNIKEQWRTLKERMARHEYSFEFLARLLNAFQNDIHYKNAT